MIKKFLTIQSSVPGMRVIQCFLFMAFLFTLITLAEAQQTPAVVSPFAAAPGSAASPASSQTTPSPTAPSGFNPFAAPQTSPAGPPAPAPGAASPFAAAPGQASPFTAPQASPAAPPVSAPGAASPFAAAPGQASPFAAPQASPAAPPVSSPGATGVTNYFEDLEAGKKAIVDQKKPGFVFLTNLDDEDNQRVAQIMTLPMFKEVLSKYITIKVDVGKNLKVLSRYGIYKTPSIILYDSEGRMRKKIQSISDMNYLMQELKKVE